MVNKKRAKKIHRKSVRSQRAAQKAQREQTRADFDGIGNLIHSLSERNRDFPTEKNSREDMNQAAARIVREATED